MSLKPNGAGAQRASEEASFPDMSAPDVESSDERHARNPAPFFGLPDSKRPPRAGMLSRRDLVRGAVAMTGGASVASLILSACEEAAPRTVSPSVATAAATDGKNKILTAELAFRSACILEAQLILQQPVPANPKVRTAYENIASLKNVGTTVSHLALLLDQYRDAVGVAGLAEPRQIHDARIMRNIAQIDLFDATSAPADVLSAARSELKVDEEMPVIQR